MTKIKPVIMVSLIVLSMFSIFVPRAMADPEPEIETYLWVANFPQEGLTNNGLPGRPVASPTADTFNGFGDPYWTGNFSLTHPIASVNSITACFQPFSIDERTGVLVEGVDYLVHADENLIELLTPLDVPVINEHWIDGVNNSLHGYPWIECVASGIESVFVDMHNGTARPGLNLGYLQPPPSEWWYDPDWPWELEGWWALGHFPGPWNWPSGSEWWINYTAASYIEVDYIARPPALLEDAALEISDLREQIQALYEDGEIDDYKYNRIANSLGLAYNLTYGAMWGLDTDRLGFDDQKEGMDYLYRVVRELEKLAKDIENWVQWGRIPSDLAEGIIEELEQIQMKLVSKAREEAEAERMLAEAALEDAEARGRYVPWLWNQLFYIDQHLEDAEYWAAEGWLSKAVAYYKTAFYYSQCVVIYAWHCSWHIAPEDWVDQLEATL